MSIKALNWALEIQVGDSLSKLILMAIANYADEHAVAWPSHGKLAEDCEMSTATVKRRIAQLEEQGLLVTFRAWMDEHGVRNRDGRGRETSKEIRLNLARTAAAPTRAPEPESEEEGVHTAPPPVTNEGVLSAPHGVLCELPGESLQHPPNEPPLNLKDSPPTPQGVREVDLDQGSSEPDGFAEVWAMWPGHEVMKRHLAIQKFAALTEAEREHVRAAVPQYVAKLKQLGRTRVENFHLWLDRKGFSEFPNVAPAAPPPRVWIPDADLLPLDVAYRIANLGDLRRTRDEERGLGLWRARFIEADLGGLAQFRDDRPDDWPVVRQGSAEFAAWSRRLQDWTGFQPKPVRRFVDPYDPAVHDLPASHPDFRLRRREDVLHVPRLWPPRRDGTFGDHHDDDATATNEGQER